MGQILQRIAIDQDQIRALANSHGAKVVLVGEIVAHILGPRAKNVVGSEASLEHHRHLTMHGKARDAELLRSIRAEQQAHAPIVQGFQIRWRLAAIWSARCRLYCGLFRRVWYALFQASTCCEGMYLTSA